jgi:hypothetical protein
MVLNNESEKIDVLVSDPYREQANYFKEEFAEYADTTSQEHLIET